MGKGENVIQHSFGDLPIECPGGLDERFCEVMDAAPVMIWVSGKDKDCIWFNRPWLTFTGRSMAQETGNGWRDGVHPDDFDRCLEIYIGHFEAREKFRMEYRLRRHDGAYRWIDDAGIPHYARDGTFLGYIGSCVDITHLKETEDARREGALRLQFALDAAKMGTFEADITATQALVDSQEASLLGLPVGTRSISVDELRKRIPIEDLQASDAKQNRLMEGAEAYRHEFRLLMSDGSERWLSGHADIRCNRIFGVNFDITERKRAEEALRDSEARLRIATSGAGLGVFEWDPETDHTVWENDRMYKIFGRTHAEGPLSKRQFVDNHLHPGDALKFEAALEDAKRTGGHFHMICRTRWKDGAHRWLQIDGKFAAAVAGGPSQFIGVVADITAGKQLQRRAARITQRLATVQEKERQNIAQELHDTTVQHLVAASLNFMILKPAPPESGKKTNSWSDLGKSLDEAMKELRTSSYLLHPPALARSLRSTLDEYISGLASRSGLHIRLRLNSKVEKLPFPVKRSLFRIVQAALANVYRHARASQVSIELRWMGHALHLAIVDDGRGLEAGARPRPGVGIRGIRARLDEIGGRFRIIPAKPHGTMVHAMIPVEKDHLRKASLGVAPLDWRRDCPDHGLACPRDSEVAECQMGNQFRCRLKPLEKRLAPEGA
jgi:PAS domain S-box-containing protein